MGALGLSTLQSINLVQSLYMISFDVSHPHAMDIIFLHFWIGGPKISTFLLLVWSVAHPDTYATLRFYQLLL